MTNALVGYIIGRYASEMGTYADFNEILMKGYSLDHFRTPEVQRFLAIQEFVSRLDVTHMKAFSALQIQLMPYFEQLPVVDLPFYFLPVAYLRGATFQEVLGMTAFLVTHLTDNQKIVDQVMCMVSTVKWSITTFSSYYPFVNRCFATIQDTDFTSSNVVGQALTIEFGGYSAGKGRSEGPSEYKLRKACDEPTHAAIRCALVYALSEVHNSGEYKPSNALGSELTNQAKQAEKATLLEDLSAPFPLKSHLSTQVDTHIINGYYRLDGFIAWQMKSNREPLLDIAVLGDAGGPDRDILRFWNFCNKHLDWEQLAHELDNFFSIRSFLRVDWRSKFVRNEIQWERQRVVFLLDNDRCLSFVPDAKKKAFVLDKSEAKNAGLPRFSFGTRPGLNLLEDVADKLMSD